MRYNTRLIFCFILPVLLLVASCSVEQSPYTINQHTDVSYVTGITVFEDAVYCATKGGLVKWDVENSEYTIYTTLDGLPSNVLSDVVVDGDGLMWIGSVDGVATFDGSYFKTYGTSDGLPSEDINDIAIDLDGTAWFGTKKGVASFSGGRFTALTDEEGPGDDSVLYVYFDQGANIWLGTDDDGLYYNADGEWKHVTTRDGIPVNTIVTIVQAWDRSVWASSWAGISRFDGAGWKTFSSMKRFETYDARQLITTDKRLWYFTANGVHASQGGDWFGFTEDEGLISNNVTCGYVVSDEEVYVGTVDGMSIIRNGEVSNYFVPSSPVGHNTISIAVDDRNRVWLGTWEDGLNLYDSGYWTQLIGRDSSTLESVRSIVFGEDGSVVFNTTNGVVFENDNDWQVYTRRDGVSGNDVRCGVYDNEGRYWAGTAVGVCYLEKGRWKRYRTVHGLPDEDTWACAKDADGTIWFGTAAGIVSFTGTELTDHTPDISLDVVDVRSMAIDGDRVLFGTNDGKIIEYRNGTWDIYGESYLGTDKAVYAIAVESPGRIWVGTNGDGIISAGEGPKVRLGLSDGLPSNFIKSIDIGNGTLWAACYGGVAEIDITPDMAAK